MLRVLVTIGCTALLVSSGCGQGSGAGGPAAVASSPAAGQANPALTPPAPTPTPAPPAPTPTPAPPAPTPTPAPPAPAISLAFGSGTVGVSVTGIAAGAHQVHVHRDCTGNPNLHLTTLGTVFVNGNGSGARTFSLAPSLRGRGFDLLVYPLGASQGPPSLCSAV